MVIVSLAEAVLQVVTKSEAATGASWMVTFIESEAVALCGSATVRVRVMVVSEPTWGAVNRVEGAVALARVMLRAESCDHR